MAPTLNGNRYRRTVRDLGPDPFDDYSFYIWPVHAAPDSALGNDLFFVRRLNITCHAILFQSSGDTYFRCRAPYAGQQSLSACAFLKQSLNFHFPQSDVHNAILAIWRVCADYRRRDWPLESLQTDPGHDIGARNKRQRVVACAHFAAREEHVSPGMLPGKSSDWCWRLGRRRVARRFSKH
jgi:hypothetical protein